MQCNAMQEMGFVKLDFEK